VPTSPAIPRLRTGSGPGLAHRIEQHIQSRGLATGNHLSAQQLADMFGASRTPVNHALRLLVERGVLSHEPRRGYFVSVRAPGGAAPAVDEVEAAYRSIARDRLSGALPDEVNETMLRQRYGLTKSQLQMLLSRVVQEGWIERRAGYGWAFTEMLTTRAALAETFRLRLVLEPASLLEPGYRLDPALAAECRKNEMAMLQGDLATLPVDALFDQRARFHETIVGGCGNRYFLDTIRRVNRIRRLLSYEGMGQRDRYRKQSLEHLAILDLIEAGRQEDAADALRRHLEAVQIHYDTVLAPAGGTGR
jgi:DNA-binding GntR family transcriptional regulator